MPSPKPATDVSSSPQIPQPGTPLPWTLGLRSVYGNYFYSAVPGHGFIGTCSPEPQGYYDPKAEKDAAYIVHACNNLPALEARVKELEEGLQTIKSILESSASPLKAMSDSYVAARRLLEGKS